VLVIIKKLEFKSNNNYNKYNFKNKNKKIFMKIIIDSNNYNKIINSICDGKSRSIIPENYLIADSECCLKKTHIFRYLWEKFCGLINRDDRCDTKLIQYSAEQLIDFGFTNHLVNDLNIENIQKIAHLAHLFPAADSASVKEESKVERAKQFQDQTRTFKLLNTEEIKSYYAHYIPVLEFKDLDKSKQEAAIGLISSKQKTREEIATVQADSDHARQEPQAEEIIDLTPVLSESHQSQEAPALPPAQETQVPHVQQETHEELVIALPPLVLTQHEEATRSLQEINAASEQQPSNALANKTIVVITPRTTDQAEPTAPPALPELPEEEIKEGQPPPPPPSRNYFLKRMGLKTLAVGLGIIAGIGTAIYLFRSGSSPKAPPGNTITDFPAHPSFDPVPPIFTPPPPVFDPTPSVPPSPPSTEPISPILPPSPVPPPPPQPNGAGEKIYLFTSYTTDNPTRLKMSEDVVANQRKYADRYGYQYRNYPENLAVETTLLGLKTTTWLPYWSKIAAINKILNHQENRLNSEPEWIVWLDDDAPITNPTIKMEDVIKYYTSQNNEIYFIVTEDAQSHIHSSVTLNSAVLIIKNNDWSREFFQKVWEMRKERVWGRDYTYGTCPNQECLHEQQAITDLMSWDDDNKWKKHIKIIPQRDENDPHGGWGINTFHRWNHRDYNRGIYLDYDIEDKPGTRWKEGDFIGQCTGMVPDLRAQGIDTMIATTAKYEEP
jgi:hypothetical protein